MQRTKLNLTTMFLAAVLATSAQPSLAQDPANQAALARARVALEVEQDYAKAERELTALLAAVKDGSLRAQATLLLARVRRDLGRDDEAKVLVEEALRLDPQLEDQAKALRQAALPRKDLDARIASEVERLFAGATKEASTAYENLLWLGADAQPTLFEILKSRVGDLTQFKTLLRIVLQGGGPVGVSAIEAYRTHEDPTLRRALIEEAGNYLQPELAKAIEVMFSDRDARVRALAVEKLPQWRWNFDHVVTALHDGDPAVRDATVNWIGRALEHALDTHDEERFAALMERVDLLTAAEDSSFRSRFVSRFVDAPDWQTTVFRHTLGRRWVVKRSEWFQRIDLSNYGSRVGLYQGASTFELFDGAFDREGDADGRVRLWIALLAERTLPAPSVDNLEQWLKLAEAYPTYNWGELVRGAFQPENAKLWMSKLHILVQGTHLHAIPFDRAGEQWSSEITKIAIDQADRLADVNGVDHLIRYLALRGTPSAILDADLFFRDADRWTLGMTGLLNRSHIDAAAARFTLDHEPQNVPSSYTGRNMLLAVATRGGATDLREVYGRAYTRGLSHSGYPSKSLTKEANPPRRGLGWLLQPHPQPLARKHDPREVAQIIRHCILRTREAKRAEADVWQDLQASLQNEDAHFDNAILECIVSDIDEHPENILAYGTLDTLIGRYPNYEPARLVADRLLRSDKTRRAFSAKCERRSSYCEAIRQQLPAIVQQATNSDDTELQWATLTLGQTGGDANLSALVDLLQHEASVVRRLAVNALALQPKSEQVLAIFDLVSDPDVATRQRIAIASQHISRLEIAPKLLVLLEDTNASIRKDAQQSLEALRFLDSQRSHWKTWLAKRGAPSASVVLLQQAQDEARSKEGRLAAIRSLGILGDAEALPFLIDLLESSDEAVRSAAKAAVDRLQAAAPQGSATRPATGLPAATQRDK